MKIELLYFDGCPTHEKALEILKECVDEYAPGSKIEIIKVESEQQAAAEKFLGSPTLRVQGQDIDPLAKGKDDYGMRCRIYQYNGQFGGTPAKEMIIKALKDA